MIKNAVAIGIFDGVHRGHKAVINAAAAITGMTPAVMTFSGSTKASDRLILTESEKAETIENLGIKTVFNLKFDDIRNLSPFEFVKLLQNEYNVANIVVGEDFKFGSGRSGDTLTLQKICGEMRIGLTITPEILYDNEKISSGRIRELLEAGEIEKAHELLGYEFYYKSRVEHGKEIGRSLGFPTINMAIQPEKVKIKQGVYICKVSFDGAVYDGITDFGIKPTVNYKGTPRLETYIKGFDGDLYDREVTIIPQRFLREEVKFDSLQALKTQMEKDIKILG
ncbi:MAG: riboflavin biosynthesis protein RibF [Ruminococcus sp.]|jgi:riboflavin kinase/FMN adenylyltransferase|nr:riboflavin biosynthesis protein RibF [Ruminococcus sp.]